MGKLLRFIANTIGGVIGRFVIYMPGPAGNTLRRLYYRRRLKHLGSEVLICEGALIEGPEHVSIGNRCQIDKYAVISAGAPSQRPRKMLYKENPDFKGEVGELTIEDGSHIGCLTQVSAHGGMHLGKCTAIASGSKVFSISGHFKNLEDPTDKHLYKLPHTSPDKDQYTVYSPVVFEDGACTGLNCTVLPGSTIGRDSWLAAGSLLHGKIPPEVIAGGIPAKVLKHRLEHPKSDQIPK